MSAKYLILGTKGVGLNILNLTTGEVTTLHYVLNAAYYRCSRFYPFARWTVSTEDINFAQGLIEQASHAGASDQVFLGLMALETLYAEANRNLSRSNESPVKKAEIRQAVYAAERCVASRHRRMVLKPAALDSIVEKAETLGDMAQLRAKQIYRERHPNKSIKDSKDAA